ncbi:sensor histidine kinase [Streptomyces sp. NPDC001922]|uniref:sensor histidine kinase n=1 Tax=Streptomyces sp. NPDC001922 TaxID=3364624 RepID=UPI0036A13E30
MKNFPDRTLPIVLMCAQVLGWPGLALLRAERVPGPALLTAALVIAPVGAALAWRRRRPVLALLAVVSACALGSTGVPPGGFAVLGTAGAGLALHAVAARCDARTTVLVAAALVGWQTLWGMSLHGIGRAQGLDILLTVGTYALALGIGMPARRRSRDRAAAARRLARAEEERRRLPEVERGRLARELHDVSAHHLTGVVVTAEAALRLGDSRPAMTREALDFVTRTGYEVLGTLVKARSGLGGPVEESGSVVRQIEELAAGLRRLGQPILLDLPSDLPGTRGEAVHGIVREALTNALRHAPDAQVRVRCTAVGDAVELEVRNAAPARAADGSSELGGGRGVAGMRERARAAGGRLTAGPERDGGWCVRAELPGSRPGAGGPARRVDRFRLAQGVAAVGLVTNPLLPALASPATSDAPGSGLGPGALTALLAGTQCLPLLGIRRAPWTVFCAVLVLSGLWPLAVALGAPDGPYAVPLLASAAVTAVTVFGVAVHRRGTPPPWAAVPLAGCGQLATVTLLAAGRGAAADGATVAWAGGAALAATGLFTGAWWAGRARRARRDRTLASEGDAFAAAVSAAVAEASAERQRMVRGLRESVLSRTGRMVGRAERGELAEAAADAREALAAMRELLSHLHTAPPDAERAPQPTVDDLDLLCRQYRALGRQVTLHEPEAAAGPLPTSVGLAAFRIVERALGAGDGDPADVLLVHAAERLDLVVSGVPRATAEPVMTLLRAQADVLGGEVTADSPGTLRVRLPAGYGQVQQKEGSPSPST